MRGTLLHPPACPQGDWFLELTALEMRINEVSNPKSIESGMDRTRRLRAMYAARTMIMKAITQKYGTFPRGGRQ